MVCSAAAMIWFFSSAAFAQLPANPRCGVMGDDGTAIPNSGICMPGSSLDCEKRCKNVRGGTSGGIECSSNTNSQHKYCCCHTAKEQAQCNTDKNVGLYCKKGTVDNGK
jgi:hypothetical protein